MTQITLMILTWNSEKTISATIKNVEKAVDEIIVLDQFSQDGTLPYLLQKGIMPYQLDWNGNMADRKNILVSHASKSHILSLDSDETLNGDAVKWMKALWEADPEAMIVFRNIQMKDESWAYERWFGHMTIRAGPKTRAKWTNLNPGINEVLPGPGHLCPYPILNWGNSILEWNKERFLRTLDRWISLGGDSVIRETGARSTLDAFDLLHGWEAVNLSQKVPRELIPNIVPTGRLEP